MALIDRAPEDAPFLGAETETTMFRKFVLTPVVHQDTTSTGVEGENSTKGGTMPRKPLLYARSHPELPDRYQLLDQHLVNVAQRARDHLAPLSGAAGMLAELVGAVHDLGKSTDVWQRYLIEGGGVIPHADIGAAWLEQNPKWLALFSQGTADVVYLLASVVAGHHGGLRNFNLPDDVVPRRSLVEFMTMGAARYREAKPDVVKLPLFVEQLERFRVPQLPDDSQEERRLARDTFTRFLFSSLVAADAEDAIVFKDGRSRDWVDVQFPSMAELAQQYEAGLAKIIEDKNQRLKVNRLRRQVSNACLATAKRLPGFYTLTAPTGLGKTFAGLRFALHHAAQHGLRRVVYTAPFTNIIEQNVQQYRNLFEDDRIVTEHHHNIDPEKDSRFNRRMSLFWSAPIVCTSSLQLFESLFSSRTGRCRKLHNIIRSCIIVDEAQELPPTLLTPIIDMMKRLVTNYGCSIIFTTATQPALRESLFENGLDNVTEIIPDPDRMMKEARRTVVQWPEGPDDRWSWDELARRIKQRPRSICTVYTRADAIEVYRRLPPNGRYHLSALMCPQHRTDILETVKERLKDNKVVRLVCTRLIKSGVNIDLPYGFEAALGPDDVLQLSGRINRDGKRRRYRSIVRVFYAAESKPIAGQPRQAHGVLREMLNLQQEATGQYGLDLTDPATYEQYFAYLYADTDTDREAVQQDRMNLDFVTVDRKMKFIRDNYMTTVLVPYRDGADIIEQLKQKGVRDYTLLRKMQRYAVAIYRQDRAAMEGLLQPVHPDLDEIYCLDPDAAPQFYRSDVGLCTPDRLRDLVDLNDLL